MDIQQQIQALTSEQFERLCYAVETGKWQDGTKLSSEQRDHAMQLVMLYQAKFNTEPQHMTIAAGGELKIKTKQELKQEFNLDKIIEIQKVE